MRELESKELAVWWGVIGVLVVVFGGWLYGAVSHEKPEYVSNYTPERAEGWALIAESENLMERAGRSINDAWAGAFRAHRPELQIQEVISISEGKSHNLKSGTIYCGFLRVGDSYRVVKFAYSTHGLGSLAVQGEDGLDPLNWAIVEDAMCY